MQEVRAPMSTDELQGAARVQGMVQSISAPQWISWVAGSALAIGLLLALAAVASM